NVLHKFPHLSGCTALSLKDTSRVPEILRGQVVVSAVRGDWLEATSVQIPGVLDELFACDEPLGMTFENGRPTIRVWAPTAQAVQLHLFPDSHPDTPPVRFPMTYTPATGVWSVTGEADWYAQFYLFEVDVFVRQTGQVEKNLVTDPYSVSLAMDSTRSQIIDLNDPALMPAGWQTLQKPPMDDIVIYELHVRDFSITDPTVSEAYRGKYGAFTQFDSNGMKHLRALADSGLTHLHLLPTFDIATLEDNPQNQQTVDWEKLAAYPPDSEEQQAAISAIRHRDAFNWGYDPYHYNVPEGSYSTEPDGPRRILEYREMVMALNHIGLRVVMDMVYNHTSESGQHLLSVFDRIVPGYYYRLNEDGQVENSTCCSNTATEHRMMEKFMLDSLRLWAEAYKIDGFRFDLMGHHMKENMVRVRHLLDSLPGSRDMYIYGEGWDFGEVVWGRRGLNATQFNLAGTGIGTFNDRLRDAVRGGNHADSQQFQGFVAGLYYEPNGVTPGLKSEQRTRLMHAADEIRVGLAGNLRDYALLDLFGNRVTGWDISHDGVPTGYNLSPLENVAYVSAHDNETLFDAIQYKAAPEVSLDERVRMHNLALSLVILAQGVPFIHGGDDLLRSKSLDRDSYDSGDWFNRIDWSYETNNWGVGLPPAEKNQHNWPIQKPLLATPALKPTRDHILRAVYHTREMLKIRKSLPRYKTAEAVKTFVKFYNVGLDQIPGVIVMGLAEEAVVIFNAANKRIVFMDEELARFDWRLHPIQAESDDTVVRTSKYMEGVFMIPARTTAVFIPLLSTATSG
ncbi:MAG: pullulanase-type alpha-1,6-glucosidase, partial [Anaerolineae bacterium]|nr:pullulanase-type alpha-1,6-glucosidase [Anaerolineae bacterium]